MTTRKIILSIVIALGVSGPAWAQTSNTITDSQNGGNFGGNFGGGFGGNFGGFGSFKFTNGSTTISQGSSADGSFCQFFSFSAGVNSIIQIIQGNSFSQSFGSTTPVDDPCE